MGGRGKSSGAPIAGPRGPVGPPLNFSDPGAIALEQLEAAQQQAARQGERLAEASSAELAGGVETAVRALLAAPRGHDEVPQQAMLRALAQAATEMKRRPEAERQAFSERLAPLFAQLREQAGEQGGRP